MRQLLLVWGFSLHCLDIKLFIMMLRVWSALVLIVGCARVALATHAKIEIIAPRDGVSFVVTSLRAASVEVEYAIRNTEESEHMRFCFDVRGITQGTGSSPESCFTAESLRFTLTDVEVGEYVLTSHLKDTSDSQVLDSISHVKFSVISYEKALPVIQLKSAPVHVLGAGDASGDLPLQFALQSSVLGSKDFFVCMWITSDSAVSVMDKACVPSSQTDIVLKGVTKGEYTFFAALQPAGASDLIESSIVSTKMQVIELHEVPLTLKLVGHAPEDGGCRYNLEYVVDAAEPIKLNVAIDGLQAAADKAVICLAIHSNLVAGQELPALSTYKRDNCYPVHTNEFTIQRSAPGLYAISFYLLPSLADAHDTNKAAATELSQRSVGRGLQVLLEVRKQEEFVPSYEWRPLRPWHSVPSGIETRLPVGTRGEAIKEARIPQPWRLQLPLPAPPCRYFLRMDLHRHSTVRDIMTQASAQCKQPANCFLVYAEDSLLGSEVTVEDCNFFQRTQKIEFDPSCLL